VSSIFADALDAALMKGQIELLKRKQVFAAGCQLAAARRVVFEQQLRGEFFG
jgi:hypothetical protein